ncbi:hypothetical protein [Streptosporangium jomthongense]|uniref:Uncharacterized protein n=1 Tax=Streptosporangium jomthongense TaxID=1193683 RepID=A0ABV8FEN9_9ACTN
MVKRIVRSRSSQQLRGELELLEALEPISEEHADAKEAYQAALTSGDPEAIRAAKARKQAASNRLNETREWLRREREIAKLSATTIPELERLLSQQGGGGNARRAELGAALEQARAQLERAQAEAAVVRRELAVLTGVEA